MDLMTTLIRKAFPEEAIFALGVMPLFTVLAHVEIAKLIFPSLARCQIAITRSPIYLAVENQYSYRLAYSILATSQNWPECAKSQTIILGRYLLCRAICAGLLLNVINIVRQKLAFVFSSSPSYFGDQSISSWIAIQDIARPCNIGRFTMKDGTIDGRK